MNRVVLYRQTIEPTATPTRGHYGFGAGEEAAFESTATQVSSIDRATLAAGEADPGIEPRFRELVRQWKEAMQYTSSTTRMVTHPAYQQIIGLGKSALPLLLDELRHEPDHWFWALRAITGSNPIPEVDQGKLGPMTAAWLRWAKENGY